MSNKIRLEDELIFEDLNEERLEFEKAVNAKGNNYKYYIYPIVKIERRIEGRYAFKDIFKVLHELKEALPVGENLYVNDLEIRSTVKQTITYPKKWFSSVNELYKYYNKLKSSLNKFLFNDEGENRYISREYRVIDFDIIVYDIKMKKILNASDLSFLFLLGE